MLYMLKHRYDLHSIINYTIIRLPITETILYDIIKCEDIWIKIDFKT